MNDQSQASIARALGLSPATVTKNKKAGMPTSSVEAARTWRANNIAPTMHGRGERQSAKVIPTAGRARAAAAGSYSKARCRRELAEASIAEMRQQEMHGTLLRADEVKSHLAGKVSALRDAFLQIPLRLAPVLAAETNQAKVYTLLETEIVRAMALVNGATEPESNTP